MTTALLALLIAGPAAAAEALGPSSRAAQPVTFRTADGWTIAAKYRPARLGRATLVLAHGYASAGVEWDRFADKLAREGIGTLAIDLRGHAGSTKGPSGERGYESFDRMTGEWATAVEDLLAAARWLETERRVKPGRVAFGGASLGANLAAEASKKRGAAFLLLLSAGPGALPDKPAMPALAAASKKDGGAWGALKWLKQAGHAETLEAPAGHGVQMFEHVATFNAIVSWVLAKGAPTRAPNARVRSLQ